jgi:hypothetical protein
MSVLEDAARFALAHGTPWPRDLRAHLEAGFFEPPPHNEILGPIRPRGGPNGLILRAGSVLARWGDTQQVDFTFSVAKSYLSLLAGIAVGDGLIRELDEPVALTVTDGGFEGSHNGAITWRHLLQQTSEWEGTLFGKSDVIDRNRNLAVEGKGRKGDARPLRPPVTFWEYNDVRVNRLALALLHLFRRPLPECSPRGSCGRSARRTRGAGMAIAHPWSRSTGGRWSLCPAAATGAAALRFMQRIRDALDR